ncbi:serine/threonine protein phosphatase [Phenylobacterium montanum]|uniref:Serine/threonine protein phosphatase n=1 Tax=Phenylobacterium montanum TaxID=2823693 RepID=A0A975G6A4_9CAUL|nr:serine/threonine protein phosphatase [Caulobacter sp. S6]
MKLWPFRTQPKVEAPPAASTGGRLVYAVGDIHGRLDLLQRLLTAISADAVQTHSNERPLVVFLGDYIDRGAESRGVIDQILTLRRQGRFEVRCLKGNHEQALLQFLEDPGFGPAWVGHGGGPTLMSYGIAPPQMRSDEEGWEATRLAFRAALPPHHLAFFETLELSLVVGDYLFVHAGVRPGVPLTDQAEQDLLWIRGDFLNDPGGFEKMIVHGHTPVDRPYIGRSRIAVDTGAYATGLLSAARLVGRERDFLEARAA